MRHNQLFDVIKSVKQNAELKLNNQLDQIIEQRMAGDIRNRNWENESCPDLHHGEEKCMPNKDWNKDALNASFPGLNTKYDEHQKRYQLIEWFNKRAAEDAERERLAREARLRAAMKINVDCQHDLELIDNCWFTSREKVEAAMQTVMIEHQDRALSVMTVIRDSVNSRLARRCQSRD